MRIKSVIICLLTISSSAFGQQRPDLSIQRIPDSLITNAFAVLRYSKQTYKYVTPVNGSYSYTQAYTVLDKKGLDMVQFMYPGDKFRTLKKFSAVIYDATGKQLMKYKQSDVVSSEYSTHLGSDNKYYFLRIASPVYPFTVVYDYEINFKNNSLSFPAFYPQSDYNLSVVNAEYELITPSNIEFFSKKTNINDDAIISEQKGKSSYKWQVKNLSALESENLAPDIVNYVPLLLLRPKVFVYDGANGDIYDWNSYGKWEYGLLKNRNTLTEETQKKITELTQHAGSVREKVKILYDYLGVTTRYVSIQLGIGGYQPIAAAEICKTGFGDCKGLTNYMKAMLEVVGINSFYTGIQSDFNDKKLYADFPNFNQMNHVILMVPTETDTLWLECTNPRIPFGFIHNNIAGHDALVVHENGGKIITLPDYPDSLNIEHNSAEISIMNDGSATVKMKKECKVKIYDMLSWFPYAKPSEQVDFLRRDINLPNVTLGALQFNENKTEKPEIHFNYDWTSSLYGSKAGSRLMIPVNPFRSIYNNLNKSRRANDIEINFGFKDIDQLTINIPDGYEIERLPSSLNIENKYGQLSSIIIKTENNRITILQSLYIPSGAYSKNEFKEFVAFIDLVNNTYKNNIVLKKL